jgi:catechol 2,3-dioxygenase-like lactoylglutathione lyase family enzyme
MTDMARDNLDAARAFFGLLGFKEDKAVVISDPTFAAYMGIPGIEADHVTLALAGADPRVEVQLLRYRRPEPLTDANIERFDKVGFNHVCSAVDDLEGEVARLRAHGVQMRNDAGLPCAQADLLEGSRRTSPSSCPRAVTRGARGPVAHRAQVIGRGLCERVGLRAISAGTTAGPHPTHTCGVPEKDTAR